MSLFATFRWLTALTVGRRARVGSHAEAATWWLRLPANSPLTRAKTDGHRGGSLVKVANWGTNRILGRLSVVSTVVALGVITGLLGSASVASADPFPFDGTSGATDAANS